MGKKPNTSEHPKKQRAFLAAYAKCGVVSVACRESGVGRTTHYDWLNSDADYRAAFDEAGTEAIESLELEARRRATEGVFKFKFDSKGNVLRDPRTGEPYQELQYSDTLLIFLLKGAKPEKYRDRVEHTGANGGPVEMTHRVEALEKVFAKVREDANYAAVRRASLLGHGGKPGANGHNGKHGPLGNGSAPRAS